MVNFKGENIDDFVVDNLKLLYFITNKYRHYFYSNESYEIFKEDLMYDYIKCCINYDKDKGFQFSAYLSKMIYGKACRFLNNFCKYGTIESLENITSQDGHLTVGSYLEAKCDVVKDVNNKILLAQIVKYIDNIDDRKRNIFLSYLSGERREDLAIKYHVSQVQISRIIRKIRLDMKKKFL